MGDEVSGVVNGVWKCGWDWWKGGCWITTTRSDRNRCGRCSCWSVPTPTTAPRNPPVPTTPPTTTTTAPPAGSEEGSCSPTRRDPPFLPAWAWSEGGRGGSVRSGGLALSSPHPALRGLNRAQAALLTCAGGKKRHREATPTCFHRRRCCCKWQQTVSALSAHPRARHAAKEQELMEVYHDIPGYGMYDHHMTELPITDGVGEDVSAGRGGGGALKVNSPGDRARFRHDPYPRVPSST
nr:uncharacterized protein LOC113813769 [Penaeus vannamei]